MPTSGKFSIRSMQYVLVVYNMKERLVAAFK